MSTAAASKPLGAFGYDEVVQDAFCHEYFVEFASTLRRAQYSGLKRSAS